MTEDEMVGWPHQLNGHEFKQTLGDGEGQGGLACCGSWGLKESDRTERANSGPCPWQAASPRSRQAPLKTVSRALTGHA